MGLDVSLALQVTIALTVVATWLLYRFFTETFDYWQKKGVPFVKPMILFGSMKTVLLMQEHTGDFLERLYQKHSTERYIGYYMGKKPTLLVRDPELIKHILIKDFSHFTDHGLKFHEEADPLQAKSLFNLNGQRWRDMRAKMVPAFTTGRLKSMLPIMLDTSSEFEFVLNGLAEQQNEFELRSILSRFYADIVGTCIFGIECNSIKDPTVEFYREARRLNELSLLGAFRAMMIFLVPEIAHLLKFSLIEKDVTNFFRRLVKDIMEIRTATGIIRKDIIQLLIKLENKEIGDNKICKTNDYMPTVTKSLDLSHDDLTAQATVFLIGGFETSSSATAYAVWELAANPEAQTKAQKEIDAVLHCYGGKITYEGLQEMKYLECVLQETMRLHPSTNLIRRCNKKYTVPGGDLEIDEGVMVCIPVSALQKDPAFYEEPDRFKPERFLDDGLVQRNQFIYSPFGIGPRQCIGLRFAMLQMKICLVTILRSMNITPGEKTKVPLQLDKTQFISYVDGGAWVKMTPRKT